MIDDLFVDTLVGVDHCLEIAGEFLGLEKLLGVEFFVSESLVFDPVHKGHALGAVDVLRGEFNELLRVALKIIETPTTRKDAVDAAARE